MNSGRATSAASVKPPRSGVWAAAVPAALIGGAVPVALAVRNTGNGWVWTAEVLVIAAVLWGLYRIRALNRHLTASVMEETRPIEELNQRLKDANDHLHALHDFVRNLLQETEIAKLCDLATRTLVENFSFDGSRLWLCERSESDIRFVHHSEFGRKDSPWSSQSKRERLNMERLIVHTIQKNESRILNDYDLENAAEGIGDETRHYASAVNFYSILIIPLMNADTPVGALTVEYHSGRRIGREDRNIAESVSSAAVNAMARNRLKAINENDDLLVKSVSNIVGDAVARLELFHDMEELIEERTRQLEKMQEEVRSAREMVIQSEKLSSLGRMAAGVLHEINDPLNFLINILPEIRHEFEGLIRARQCIDAAVSDPAPRAKLDAISREFNLEEHLAELDYVFEKTAGSLAKSTRIARGLSVFTGKSESDVTVEANLLELAEQASQLIPNKLKGEVVVAVTPAPDCRWSVNSEQIEQVFINLFTNAIDAMNRTGAITVRSGAIGAGRVELIVEDTGPGIPPNLLDRIFEPFFTTKPAGKSTGLGLSISAEILKKFGGMMHAENRSEGGARFVMRFMRGVETNATAEGKTA